MRKIYLDNIRWITVLLVVIYHVIYMFNGVTTYCVMGPLVAHQPQDLYLYIVVSIETLVTRKVRLNN